MTRKSKGARQGTRFKMQSKKRIAPSEFLKEFAIGDRVHVDIQPNIKARGYPYIKFQGKTGEVIGKRGRAYIVGITDGNAEKKIILSPVHLRKQAKRAVQI